MISVYTFQLKKLIRVVLILKTILVVMVLAFIIGITFFIVIYSNLKHIQLHLALFVSLLNLYVKH